MKKLLCLIVMLACAFVFFGCTQNESDAITFGILGPFSGNLSVYGTSVREGAMLAIDDLNANGGILGKQVKALSEDDEGDPKKVLSAYNKLIDNIDFLIGEVTSGNSELIATQVNKDKVPAITPSATADSVTKNREYMFRACFLDPTQGETMADFTNDTLKVKKVAIVYDLSDDYSKGVASAYEEKAKALGLEIVLNDGGLRAKDNDQRNALIAKIKGSNAEAVFAPIYYEDAALLAKGLRQEGYTAPLLGADGYDGILRQLSGTGDYTPANNVFFSNHYCASDENIKEFSKKYNEKYGKEPTSFAALAYDAVMMAAKAMENAKSTEKALVKDALQKLEYKGGLTGDIKFNEQGDPIKTICICEYKDGEMVLKQRYVK